MKKFLLAVLVMALTGFTAYLTLGVQAETTSTTDATGSTTVACTQEYAPVCGQPKMPACSAGLACVQMMPAPKTYSNKCILSAEGAEYLYAGECKTPVVCPEVSMPAEKAGCKITSYVDDNGCKKVKQVCEQTACTQEYSPVCGQKEVCSSTTNATTGSNCSSTQKTFGNKCLLNAAGYKYVSEGECKTPVVCPVYDPAQPKEGCYYEWVKDDKGCKKPKLICKEQPVCPVYDVAQPKEGCTYEFVTDDKGCKKPKLVCMDDLVCKYAGTKSEGWYTPEGKLYKYADCSKDEPVCPVYDVAAPAEGCYYEYIKDDNGCKKPKLVCKETKCRDYSTVKLMTEMNGCPLTWYTDENGCKAHKYECKKDDRTEQLKKRVQASIEALFKKLDASDMSVADKIAKLEKVAASLKELATRKPQYNEVLSFAVEKINVRILQYDKEQDDGSDIFDILGQ